MMHVDDKVRRYLMQIVHETRKSHEDLSLGASPRASTGAVSHGRRRWRPSSGRNFVLPDDVKRVAPPRC